MSLRCKDERFPCPQPASWFVPWCPHSRPMRSEDIQKTGKLHTRKDWGNYWDGRCINWLRICTKTKKVVVHNKKCDVLQVVEAIKHHRKHDDMNGDVCLLNKCVIRYPKSDGE